MLLKETADRLKGIVRQEDTVSRIGGDEFAIFIENLGEIEENALLHITRVAEKILLVLSEKYSLGAQDYYSSASIGVNLFHDNNISMDELINYADMAMYKAKSLGRNRVQFFDIHLQEAVEHRAAIETDLHLAFDNNQLILLSNPNE